MPRHLGTNPTGAAGMRDIGPMVRLRVGAPRLEPHPSEQLLDANLLVDTGAQRTCVREDLLQQLGLAPVRGDLIVGVSGKPESCLVYRACIEVGMADERGDRFAARFVADVIGVQAIQYIDGLLGRDFLSNVNLSYRGPDGMFELIDPRSAITQSHRQSFAAGPISSTNTRRKAAEASRKKNRRKK